MTGSRLALAVSAAATVAVICASLALAAFTDRQTSPQTLQAASSWPVPLRIASGSYTGNAVSGRAITNPGFRPDLVIIRGETNQPAIARTSTMTGDQAKPLVGAVGVTADTITSLDAGGFTIGSSSRVNGAGTVYHWVAIEAGSTAMALGTYRGDGAPSRSIGGVPFSPRYVAVLDAGANRAVQRFAGMSQAYQFDGGSGASNRITSLDANGFTVGSATETNAAGNTYYWYAFNDVVGEIKVGSYTGDGSDKRDIPGVGFQPTYVSTRAASTSAGAQRFGSQSGDAAFAFGGAAAAPNLIQAVLSDRFQIGSDASVNASGSSIYYLALHKNAGACSQAGTYSTTQTGTSYAVANAGDTWLDQASSSSASGATDTSLRVRSQQTWLVVAVDQNRRVLVKFTLNPSTIDADCEIKSATLGLTATSTPGRTLNALRIAGAWGPTATWTNQPATTGTAVTASSGSTVEWDVKAQVAAMYPPGTNNGWLIKDAAENETNFLGLGSGPEQAFASSENATVNSRPNLVLNIGAK